MRAEAPTTRVDAGHLTVRTPLLAEDGSELPPLEVSLPRDHADLFDPTATASLGALAAVAAARGEDLEVEGPVDAVAAAGASRLASLLADWWGTGPVRVRITETYATASSTGGVGLFFTRGVDSWSTLLDLLDEAAEARVTHLLAVHHGGEAERALEASIIDGHRMVADELGLELVVLTTNARRLLDPHRPWIDTCGPALVSAGLVAGTGLGRMVLSGSHPADVHTQTGADPDLLPHLTTGCTEVVLGNPARLRDARLAHILDHPLARATLQVCEEGRTPGNCGRCLKCEQTISGLILAGDPDPHRGFDAPLDLDRVRGRHIDSALDDMVRGLREDLPPEHEELRRAWADAWATSHGEDLRTRWGTDSPPALAGPGVAHRVAAGLRAATGQAEAPAPAPLGWRPRAVPFRPALADHDTVRARTATAATRPRPWAVVESQIRDGARDGAQADLALRCQAFFGPGVSYLPVLIWSWEDPPVLDADAVGRLLRTGRARLWWRESGDLEPLRVVESIEQGCLPLQVMPDGPAADLARALDPALGALVVAEGTLGDLDLSPAGITVRLVPAVEHLLAGSADRDLIVGALGG